LQSVQRTSLSVRSRAENIQVLPGLELSHGLGADHASAGVCLVRNIASHWRINSAGVILDDRC